MNDMSITTTTLFCPNGKGDTQLPINIVNICNLEARKHEVAMVNKIKAPELMQCFEEGFSECAKVLPRIAYELSVAKNEVSKREAVVNLDEAPRILREKGLTTGHSPAGGADMRDAVLKADKEYIDLQDRVEQIKAIYEFIRGKQKGFEMSFSAVKKVYDSLSQYGALQGGADTSIEVGGTNVGKPRY
jgi:hypothetical protein